ARGDAALSPRQAAGAVRPTDALARRGCESGGARKLARGDARGAYRQDATRVGPRDAEGNRFVARKRITGRRSGRIARRAGRQSAWLAGLGSSDARTPRRAEAALRRAGR